jgi:general nucleoside transport system permease protein
MNEHLGWVTFLTAVAAAAVQSGTPIAFAAVGETIAERAGVINLGLEGLMLVGALAAVAVKVQSGSTLLALLAAGLVASLLASVHAFLVVGLNGNQIVSGVAISILGTGLSSFLGRSYVGVQFNGITAWRIPYLKDLPFVGRVIFQQDPLVYLCVLLAAATWFLLYRTRFGLRVRAVGEDPQAAYAQAIPVQRTRVIAILLGGFLGGVGGAHLSLAYAQVWAERMTAGQGIIAVGLVIVAGWRPLGVLVAAYVFGVLTVLHPNLQAAGFSISPYLIKMLPYVAAILALIIATVRYDKLRQGAPAALMTQFSLGRD